MTGAQMRKSRRLWGSRWIHNIIDSWRWYVWSVEAEEQITLYPLYIWASYKMSVGVFVYITALYNVNSNVVAGTSSIFQARRKAKLMGLRKINRAHCRWSFWGSQWAVVTNNFMIYLALLLLYQYKLQEGLKQWCIWLPAHSLYNQLLLRKYIPLPVW